MLTAAVSFVILASAAGSTCDYVSDKVQYIDVEAIDASGPVFIGKAPLPENIQGVFWFKDDGGDGLVSFGGPHENDECSNGKLTEDTDNSGKFCTAVSTVRPGGWTYQAEATPSPFGGHFPSVADKFYLGCGEKWKFCFDSNSNPTSLDAAPISTRGFPCVNVFEATKTTGVYKGTQNGGHLWRVTTKAFGVFPLPSFVPGNFDVIQVMDGSGNRVQPAWDTFAAANKQIVYYQDDGEAVAQAVVA